MNESTVSDYIRRSKLTGQGRNGIAFAEEFWDFLAAHYDLSIFWKFIPKQMYFHSKGLHVFCKVSMLSFNIYHFFIKKGCFEPCWENFTNMVLNGRDDSIDFESDKMKTDVIEILLIGYFSGMAVMPGAHYQFQFWFMYLMPLLIEMVGLPYWSTFWIYRYMWPINLREDSPNLQHQLILGLLAWHLIVGPCQDGLIPYYFGDKSAINSS